MKFSVNPLKTCRLRTAGLRSVEGARFGLTRLNPDGSERPHQGIDLATDEGYRLYAVENGEVVAIAKGLNGYGYTVTLKLETNNSFNGKFAFYAHLDRIDVKPGQKVKAGDVIGLSGDTGNAHGMNEIKKGSHLHFELRTSQNPGLGLIGRLDPEPYVIMN
jgi:murein DD-endopeptidase MepM/ murein hydrolase activator NlpD